VPATLAAARQPSWPPTCPPAGGVDYFSDSVICSFSFPQSFPFCIMMMVVVGVVVVIVVDVILHATCVALPKQQTLPDISSYQNKKI
jgi:hypothetical protein